MGKKSFKSLEEKGEFYFKDDKLKKKLKIYSFLWILFFGIILVLIESLYLIKFLHISKLDDFLIIFLPLFLFVISIKLPEIYFIYKYGIIVSVGGHGSYVDVYSKKKFTSSIVWSIFYLILIFAIIIYDLYK